MMSFTKSLSLTVAQRAPELEVHARGEGDLGDFQTLKLAVEVLRSRDAVSAVHCCAHQCQLSSPTWHHTSSIPHRFPSLESLVWMMVCSSQDHELKTLPLAYGTNMRGRHL